MGHDVRFERVVMVRGLKSRDNFFLKFLYFGILLVIMVNNTRKGSNNRLLHLVDADYFFYRLIFDAYRVISHVSL